MSELSPKEMEVIARKFVRESVRIRRRPDGRYEAVQVAYNATDPTCEAFTLKVEEECWQVGAHTLLLPYRSTRARLRHVLSPADSLKETSPLDEAIARKVDVRIFVGEIDDPNWARGIEDRVKLAAPIRQYLRGILDRRKVRWAYFGWPVPGKAEHSGFSVNKFRAIFFNAIKSSFARDLAELCNFYRKSLEEAEEVRVMAEDGTDLSFRIKGRPILIDDAVISDEDLARGDVGLNIPSGEVFLAPLETSAYGRIFFERVSIPGFGTARELWVEFRKGRVVNFEASEGADALSRFLSANTGDIDRIAEFGIGCNKGAEYTGISIIVDEKIYGTIHVAIGHNRGTWHGRNKASGHLDMIKDMREGELIVDGTTVMRRGEPAF